MVPLPLCGGDCSSKGQVVLPTVHKFSTATTRQEELSDVVTESFVMFHFIDLVN